MRSLTGCAEDPIDQLVGCEELLKYASDAVLLIFRLDEQSIHWNKQNSYMEWITFPGSSSHRYSVNFSSESEILAFATMFRVVLADFLFNISGHN